MQVDTKQKLSSTTVWLHWIIAIMIIGLLIVGVYMEENEVYRLYPIHKSLGVIVFGFVILRVIWRIKNGWPQTIGQQAQFLQLVSKIVHYVLIIGTVLMPISGMLMSGAGGHGIAVFGVELLAKNPDPANAQAVLALNKTWAGIGHEVHEWLAYILVTSVVLHIAGALKHHVLDKDGTLRRMLGKAI